MIIHFRVKLRQVLGKPGHHAGVNGEEGYQTADSMKFLLPFLDFYTPVPKVIAMYELVTLARAI